MNTGIRYYSQTIPEKKGSYSAKFNTTAQVGSTFKRIGVDQCTCVMGTYSLYRLVSIASSELSFFANWTVQWYGKFHCGRVLFTLNNNIIVITFNIISLATIPNQISNTWHPYTTFLNRPVKKKILPKSKKDGPNILFPSVLHISDRNPMVSPFAYKQHVSNQHTYMETVNNFLHSVIIHCLQMTYFLSGQLVVKGIGILHIHVMITHCQSTTQPGTNPPDH